MAYLQHHTAVRFTISVVTLAVGQHYYVRDNVHVERSFSVMSCYSGLRGVDREG